MFKYLALSGLLLFSACISSKKSAKSSQFQYGDTKEEVVKDIQGRTELLVAEFQYPQGHLVAYQYSRIGRSASRDGQYYLYFMNDTLIRKSSPEDLEEGARIAVKEYYQRKKQLEIKRKEQAARKQEQEESKLTQDERKQQQKSRKNVQPRTEKHLNKHKKHKSKKNRKHNKETTDSD